MGDGFEDARQAWLCLVGKADGMAETHLCGTGVYSPHKKGRLEYKWQPESGPEHVGKERPLACMRDVCGGVPAPRLIEMEESKRGARPLPALETHLERSKRERQSEGEEREEK